MTQHNQYDTSQGGVDKDTNVTDSNWLRHLVSRSSEVISIAAAVIAAFVGFSSVFLYEEARPSLSASEEVRQFREEFQRRTSEFDQRVKVLEQYFDKLENSNSDAANAILSVKVDDHGERLVSLERTLDTQPREIIELTRLRDDIEDMQLSLESNQSRTIREIDRTYNTMLALVGALLVAVVSMVIGNLFRGDKS